MSVVMFLVASASAAVVDQHIQLTRPPRPANPIDAKPAKELFGAKAEPSAGTARAIGAYANGCLAGAAALPVTGPEWQVMRLSRNRNWGHPALVRFIERYAGHAKAAGWPGLLVGDMSQPRGGPMLNGHSSHQVGLDVDVWLTPMPDHELSAEEREKMAAPSYVASNGKEVDASIWTPAHLAMIRAAAIDPAVDRIFVNAAIKKQLCQDAGSNRAWLHKVRAWYKHNDHEHIRLRCPPRAYECKGQPPVPAGEGCGNELDYWFTAPVLHPKPSTGPGRELTLASLPAACRKVLDAPAASSAEATGH
jgi:penicillin-insensitive murein endopeptidase